jgi:hypothetical protein
LTVDGLPRLAEHQVPTAPQPQLELFPAREHDVVRSLREIDTDRLTPLEALQLLVGFKATIGQPMRRVVA